MARLEVNIDGTADGLESAATRALGILEKLQIAADKLRIDLFQATTVEELNSVGIALTAVTGRMNDYITAALRGNSVWQDQQASKALETLDGKLRVVNGNAEIFGRTLATDKQELRAYQQALDAMLKAGLDPTDARVKELTANINRLNASITATAQGQKNPFSQFENASGIIGNLENRLKNLREAIRNATDERSIVSLNRRLRETQDELARLRGIGDQNTGMLNRLEAEAKRLRTQLRFAQSEAELKQLGTQIRAVEGEITRLNGVAGVMNRTFGHDGRQSFNQFGLEFGRIIQDLPYASRAFGAATDNFGAIGNNITRMVELFPGYIAMLQATVVASGAAATATNVLKAAFNSFFTGANAWLLGISLLVSGIQVYMALQQKAKRETDAAAKANRDYAKGLGDIARALYEGAKQAQQDIAKLNTFIAVTRDASASIETRRSALKELQDMYPRVFGNFDTETIKTQKATEAYEELTKAIIANANARAAEGRVAEKAAAQIALDEQNNALEKQISLLRKERLELDKPQAPLAGAPGIGEGEIQRAGERAGIESRILKLQEQQTANLLERAALQEDINKLTDFALQNQLSFDSRILDTSKETAVAMSKQLNYAERIAAIAEKSAAKEAESGLTGLDLDVAKIMTEYQGLYADLDRLQERINRDTKLTAEEKVKTLAQIDATRAQLGIDEAARLSAAEIKYAKETENAIAEIREEAGLGRARTLQDELARISAHYNELRRKYEGQQEVLEAIDDAHRASNEKAEAEWAGRLTDIRLSYTRRMHETQSQMLKRQLDEEFRARVALAKKTLTTEKERLEAQEKLQAEYWKRLEAIQQFERMERLANDFGEAFSRAFETSLTEGKNIFEQIYQEFKRLIIRMIAQQAALKAANIFGKLFGIGKVNDGDTGRSTLGTLIEGIGNIFGSGKGASWLDGLKGIFGNGGEGGKFVRSLNSAFSSNSGGGGFLRTLGSLFSGLGRGGGGGGFWRAVGGIFRGIFGGGGGSFPTGNFGGGNIPAVNPMPGGANFVPGISAVTGSSSQVQVFELRGNTARTLVNRDSRFNTRFNGGQ